VTPFLALGQKLKRLGHSVTMRLSPLFETLVLRYGLEFSPVGPLLSSSQLKSIALKRMALRDPCEQWPTALEGFAPGAPRMYADPLVLCTRADALIASPFLGLPLMIEEKLGIPHISIRLSKFGQDDDQMLHGFDVLINGFRKSLGFSPVADPYRRGGDSQLLSIYASSAFLTGYQEASVFYAESQSSQIPQDLKDVLQVGEQPI